MSRELDYNLDKICKLKEKYTEWFEMASAKGPESIDAKEAGEVADIIKDLAEAERNCREACYYKTVTEAMEEHDDGEYERYGYNPSHYASGRFAPKGRGMRYGYRPYLDTEPYIESYLHDPDFKDKMRMGYRENSGDYSSGYGAIGNNSKGYNSSRHGNVYDGYRNAKRYYTETKSMNDKMEMEKYSKEYLTDVLEALKEMWVDAETPHKQQMKDSLTKFVGTLTV